MKPSQIALAAVLSVSLSSARPGRAATEGTNQTKAEQADAGYTKAIDKRAADVVNSLGLKGSTNAPRLHEILAAQYHALKEWHKQNDAKLERAAADEAREINISLKTLHDKFLASLSAVLTPEQVEKVKDQMTYDKARVTFNAYRHNVPNLTEAQKQKILEWLKEAREEAMDAGSIRREEQGVPEVQRPDQ